MTEIAGMRVWHRVAGALRAAEAPEH